MEQWLGGSEPNEAGTAEWRQGECEEYYIRVNQQLSKQLME